MKHIRTGLLLILFSFSALGANLRLKALPGDQGYKLTGSLLESDLNYVPGMELFAPIHMGYQTDNLTGYRDKKFPVGVCPTGKKNAVEQLNNFLASGVILNGRSNLIFRGLHHVFIYCSTRAVGKPGAWAFDSLTAAPPVEENAPFCQTDIADSINLGTLSIGQTTRGTLTGRITCDKDATVSVSLRNVVDKTAPPGILRLDDAVVRYDVAGTGTARTWQIAGKNQQPFDLNFNVEDTGQKPARKASSLVLIVEAQ